MNKFLKKLSVFIFSLIVLLCSFKTKSEAATYWFKNPPPNYWISIDTYRQNDYNHFWWSGINTSDVVYRARVSVDGGSSYSSWSAWLPGGTSPPNVLPEWGINNYFIFQYQVGNGEVYTSYLVYLDLQDPTFTITGTDRKYQDPVNMSITPKDDALGIDYTDYTISKNSTVIEQTRIYGSQTKYINFNETAFYSIKAIAYDKGGNYNTYYYYPTMDNIAPVITYTPEPQTKPVSEQKVKIKATDVGMGISSFKVALSLDGGITWGNEYLSLGEDVEYTLNSYNDIMLRTYAVDKAGNSTTKYSNIYRTGTGLISDVNINADPVGYSTGLNDVYGSGNNLWVKPNDQFYITIKGKQNKIYGNVKINGVYATIRDSNWNQSVFNGYIKNDESTSNKGGASGNLGIYMDEVNINRETNYDGENYTNAKFRTKLPEHGKTYYVYPLLRIYRFGDYSNDNNIEKESPWWEEGKQLIIKTDGKAPIADKIYTENLTDTGFDVIIEGVKDENVGLSNISFDVYNENKGIEYGNLANFINKLYQSYLGRNPTQSEFDSMRLSLVNGTKDMKNCAIGLSYQAYGLSDSIFLSRTVELLEDRQIVDPNELMMYKDILRFGGRIALINTSASMSYKTNKGIEISDGKYKFHVDLSKYSYEAGEKIKVNVSGSDYLKNYGLMKTLSVTGKAYTPINSALQVKKADYKENDNIYWNKPNSPFSIYTEGYLESDSKMFPTRTYLALADGIFDENTSPQQYASAESVSYKGKFNNYFISMDIAQKASQRTENNKNYLYFTHNIKGINNLDEFKLYYTNSYISNGKETYDKFVDSGIWMKIDGIKPSVLITPNSSEWTKSNVDVNINVSDSESGLNKWKYRIAKDGNFDTEQWSEYKSGSNSIISLTEEGLYKVQVEAVDNVGNVNTVTSETYKIDKTAPGGIFNPNKSDLSISSQNVTFTPSDSGGSGVKEWKYAISYNEGNSWSDWTTIIGNVSKTINLDKVSHAKIMCEVIDVAGNISTITSGIYNIIDPKPNNSSLNVIEYDYKESDLIYWVKPNSMIGIYTDGYFPSSYNTYPTRNYILFALNNNYNSLSSRQYADILNHYWYGAEYQNNFNFINNGDKATQSTKNNNNYLSTTHHLTAKNDGLIYDLYHATTFINNGTEYYSGYVNSGVKLKVDGKAPTGSTTITMDKNLLLNISVNSVSDNQGSGTKKLYATFTDPDRGTEKNIDLVKESDTTYKLTIDAYNDLFKSEKLHVKIFSVDNVGNVQPVDKPLYEKDFDLFTINAVLNPQTAKQGEKLRFDIFTTGYPNKIDIKVPDEIAVVDETKTLVNNKIVQAIESKAYLETNIGYYLPLKTPLTLDLDDNKLKDKYKFTITAYRPNGTIRTCEVTIDVRGNIYNGFRTRFK